MNVFSRKQTFLAAFAATAIALVACAAPAPPSQPAQAPAAPAATSAPAATTAPAVEAPAGKYQEAPALAALVKEGKLPPVDQRVSENPLVVTPLEEVGQYGGTWRRAWKGPADFHAYGRLNYEEVLRWPRNPGDPVGPGLAYKWEFSPDGKDLTLYFREGLRWSDGEPWTVDDIIFWWEDIEQNKDLSPSIHAEWMVNGKPMTLEKIDDYTIKLKFDGPNGLVLRMLAFHGNQWPLNFERFGFYAPAHYLKKFHPKYNKDYTDYKEFNVAADDLTPNRPAMTPWTVAQYNAGDPKLIATRNPYYWKVDTAGNQLPYIDQIEMSLVENNDAVAAKALACEIDMQFRSLDLRKFPLFKENEQKCDYRVLRWQNANGTNVAFWPNQSYAADPELAKIFQNRDFRIALSHAIDRKKINAVSYLDQGTIQSTMVVPQSAFYDKDLAGLYTEYDPQKAGELLDKAGLKMGPDGVRLRPDGKPLEVVIETQSTGADLDTIQLVAEAWNAVGVKSTVKTMTRDLYWPRATGNEVQIATWGTDRGLEPYVDPIYVIPFDERSWMAPAFGTWYKSGGEKGVKPDGKLAEGQELYNQFRNTVDPEEQLEIGRQLVKLATEEAWTISTVGVMPSPVVVKNNFRNVPETTTTDWIFMSPGNLDTAQFFFKQ
jgi:peptide/nickel transport system substrate-binding protein